jgi:hypothetical protein
MRFLCLAKQVFAAWVLREQSRERDADFPGDLFLVAAIVLNFR